ncbi:MAG: hypothetical protein R2796_07535 [Chitinophagaceae bacterium]|nr:hypothetical protein [Chitinophagaceae bacterium]HQV06133.1 hypothetical protein [Chitinophagaceae bacterium]
MKIFRLFVFFILSVIAVIALLCFLLPTQQTIRKSIVINTSDTSLYQALQHLRNVEKIMVWSQQDSTAVYQYSPTDDSIGSFSSWKGDPFLSGEGKISITGLVPYKLIQQKIDFTTPKKGTATASFHLQPIEKNETKVTWQFSLSTPRPRNIFNLFAHIEDKMGTDIEKGLQRLKKIMEAKDSVEEEKVINK